MARVAFRFTTATVGVALLAGYLMAALLVAEVLRYLWSIRPGTLELVVTLVVITLGSTYISYRFGTARLLAGIEADRLPPERAPELHRRLDGLIARMDVDRPTLYVADTHAPTAFAIGGSDGGALVVDRSLFRLLPPPEIEAILAHELAHLETNDGLAVAMIEGIARAVVGVTTIVALPVLLTLSGLAVSSAWIRGRPGDRSGVFSRLRNTLVAGLVSVFVLATLLARSRSRKREFAADDRAATVTGDPLALAKALRRIERATEPPWFLAPLSRHRETNDSVERWLSTHPPVDDRVERLQRRAERESTSPDWAARSERNFSP